VQRFWVALRVGVRRENNEEAGGENAASERESDNRGILYDLRAHRPKCSKDCLDLKTRITCGVSTGLVLENMNFS
jgi:hypothetical protein